VADGSVLSVGTLVSDVEPVGVWLGDGVPDAVADADAPLVWLAVAVALLDAVCVRVPVEVRVPVRVSVAVSEGRPWMPPEPALATARSRAAIA